MYRCSKRCSETPARLALQVPEKDEARSGSGVEGGPLELCQKRFGAYHLHMVEGLWQEVEAAQTCGPAWRT